MLPQLLLLGEFDLNEFMNGNGPILILVVVIIAFQAMGKLGGDGNDLLTRLVNMLLNRPAPTPPPVVTPVPVPVTPAPVVVPLPVPTPAPAPLPVPAPEHPILESIIAAAEKLGPVALQILLQMLLKKQAAVQFAALEAAKAEGLQLAMGETLAKMQTPVA